MLLKKDYCFIIKVTKDCNLRCKYCYHFNNNKQKDNKSTTVTYEVLEQIIKALLTYNSHNAHFIWHGGEPLLIGIDFFKQILALQRLHNTKKLAISNSIQTNGTILNQEWIHFFKENDFHVGISIDGYKELHLNNRNFKDEEAFSDLLSNVKLLYKERVRFGILSVVNKESLGNESKIFNFFVKNRIYNIGFLPSIVTNNGTVKEEFSIDPIEYGKFLINYYDVWRNSNVYGISIREFDEYFRGKLKRKHRLCTNSNDCYQYFTVTPAGDIHLCDCFPSDEYSKVGTVFESLKNINSNSSMKKFKSFTQNTPEECKNCEYSRICNGGCKYYRYISDKSFSSPGYYCSAFKSLYEYMDKSIGEEVL